MQHQTKPYFRFAYFHSKKIPVLEKTPPNLGLYRRIPGIGPVGQTQVPVSPDVPYFFISLPAFEGIFPYPILIP